MMRVHIVCYEDVKSWILGKFAVKLNEELNKMGISCDIGKTPDMSADINHHIIYTFYKGEKSTCDTLMITHVDRLNKFGMLKRQFVQAAMGICLSKDTMERLFISGLPREKLCYINPAHDGIIKPRPVVVGITSKMYEDGRKLENLLVELCDKINPEEFVFKIMGAGWERIIDGLRSKGFKIEYYDAFDYGKYAELIQSLDYYLYFSHDEGSMGFIDALAAGVRTIVTPQGYHLDADGGIAYPISGLNELYEAFEKIAGEKRKLTASVKNWTWANYALKHTQVWEYLLNKPKYNYLMERRAAGNDGIASVAASGSHGGTRKDKVSAMMALIKGSFRTNYHNYREGRFTITGALKKRVVRAVSGVFGKD
jgi:hypothetical protein